MKVKLNYGIRTYSGTLDDMVFGSFNQGGYCQGRKYVKPVYTTNNQHMGAIGKNLKNVYHNAATAYVTDLKTYCTRNKKDNVPWTKRAPSPLAMFYKMMYAWSKTDPLHIDLTAVTIADIVTMDAEVMSLERAIDAGYLPSVKKYNDLTSEIQ